MLCPACKKIVEEILPKEKLWDLDGQHEDFIIDGYWGVEKTPNYYLIKGFNQCLKELKARLNEKEK